MSEGELGSFAEDHGFPVLWGSQIAQNTGANYTYQWLQSDPGGAAHLHDGCSTKPGLNSLSDRQEWTAPSSSSTRTHFYSHSKRGQDRRRKSGSTVRRTFAHGRETLSNISPNRGLHRSAADCEAWSASNWKLDPVGITVAEQQEQLPDNDISWTGHSGAENRVASFFCDDSVDNGKAAGWNIHLPLPEECHNAQQSSDIRKSDADLDDSSFPPFSWQQKSLSFNNSAIDDKQRMDGDDFAAYRDYQTAQMRLPPTPTSLPSPAMVLEEQRIYQALHSDSFDLTFGESNQEQTKQMSSCNITGQWLSATQANMFQESSWHTADYDRLYNSLDDEDTACNIWDPPTGDPIPAESAHQRFEEADYFKKPFAPREAQRAGIEPSFEAPFADMNTTAGIDATLTPWDYFIFEETSQSADPDLIKNDSSNALPTETFDKKGVEAHRMRSRRTTPMKNQRDRGVDDFLVRCKRRGMSYKEIKTKGGFMEAESTLRGRFRTLTKPKEERVRKPAWQESDVCFSFSFDLIITDQVQDPAAFRGDRPSLQAAIGMSEARYTKRSMHFATKFSPYPLEKGRRVYGGEGVVQVRQFDGEEEVFRGLGKA